jgi:molecular chaperone HscB
MEPSPSIPTWCTGCATGLANPMICRSCHRLQESSRELDHFRRFGVPMSYRVNPAALEERLLLLSRDIHPDYFTLAPADQQVLSIDLASRLNDAYSTLRDPFKRAEYLLERLGGPGASDHKGMPAGFLESVLETRMEIEEAQETADSAALARIRAELESRRAETFTRIAAQFEALAGDPSLAATSGQPLTLPAPAATALPVAVPDPSSGDSASPVPADRLTKLRGIRETLNTIRYLDGMLGELAG